LKNTTWKQIAVLLILNIVFVLIAQDLPQKNSEELFLTDKSALQFKQYISEFGREELTFFSFSGETKQWPSLLASITLEVEKRNGVLSDLSKLMPQQGIFEVSIPDDQERFYFFKSIEGLHPLLSFAGMSFTNAHLAGMSIKIQKVLFPLVFGLIFVFLLLFFRHLPTAIFLFISSLTGATIGLATVKVIFGSASILTNLTPLVGFILTLANQFHLVFGLATYDSKQEFIKKKMAPILIMMATTIIGFASLMTSDLISIRQFGITTTISLTLTWTIVLLIFWKMPAQFKVPNLLTTANLRRPLYAPIKGFLIVFLVLISGISAIFTMPKLVEAVYFFPKDHPVRLGNQAIEKNLGGTPQIDLLLKKKDGSDFTYADYRLLNDLEKKYEQNGIKILSANQVVAQINQQYTGNNSLPENELAYLTLKGKIPDVLQRKFTSEKSYRISVIDRALEESQRKALITKLNLLENLIPQHFIFSYVGLNHLLLESQSALVDTLLQSLLGSFAVIACLFAFFSRNLREIVTFAIISITSIFGGIALMKIFGFSLNVSSIMTLSISIGLVDDSTIHLLYAERHGDPPSIVLRTCLLPMILSQGLLLLSFSLLGIESFLPIRQFAFGLVLMLLVGFLFDLFILPLISKK
jgi:predicted RND superfamily exporter protein